MKGFRIKSVAVAREKIFTLYGSGNFSSSTLPSRCSEISAVASNVKKSIISAEIFSVYKTVDLFL